MKNSKDNTLAVKPCPFCGGYPLIENARGVFHRVCRVRHKHNAERNPARGGGVLEYSACVRRG